MENQHMSQQVFADFLQQSPATLSSIFNGRTRPTLNVVDAIKSKIPDINIEWLLYGTGEMFVAHPDISDPNSSDMSDATDLMLKFEDSVPMASHTPQESPSQTNLYRGAKNLHPELVREEAKGIDKAPRKVTEIRVYYDDQTYETFVPAKK